MSKPVNWIGLAFLLLASSLCTTGYAQKVSLKGNLTTEEGEPAEFVTVLVNGGQYVAESDHNGNYVVFVTRPTDTLRVEYLSMNFEDKRLEIPYNGQETLVRDVELETKYLNSGVVTITDRVSQRLEKSSISMEVLETKNLDMFANSDLRSSLEQIPGVTVNGNQVSMRGSSGWSYGVGSRIVVLLNGSPIMTGDRQEPDWNSIPVDNIERVEVMKGASSVMYGSGAMGGVINIITKSADEPRTTIRARMSVWDKPANDSVAWIGRTEDDGRGTSDLDEMRTDTNLLNDVTGVGYSINLTHQRKFGENYEFQAFADIVNDQGHKENLGQRRYRLMLMNKYRLPSVPGLTFGLNMQASRDRVEENPVWRSYPENALRRGLFAVGLDQIRFNVDPSITYLRNKTLVRYQGRMFVRALNTSFNDFSINYYNDISVSQYLLNDRLNLVGGITYNLSQARSNSDFANANSHQPAVYLQARYSPLPDKRLNLVFGFRYQFERIHADTSNLAGSTGNEPPFGINTLSAAIVRGGVNYQVTNSTYLRANIGQTVRAPTLVERFTNFPLGGSPLYLIPNPDLKLERGWTAELGARQLFQSDNKRVKGYIDLAAFTLQYTNLIEYYLNAVKMVEFIRRNLEEGREDITEEAFAFQPQNIASASIYGAELTSQLEYKLNDDLALKLMLGFTYTEPRDNNGADSLNGDENADFIIDNLLLMLEGELAPEDFPEDRPSILKYRQKWLLRTSLNVRYKDFDLTLLYRYNSHMINIDKVFLAGDAIRDAFGLDAFTGIPYFRSIHNSGYHEVDLTAGWQVSPAFYFSFHVFNLFNAEYMTLPGDLGPQRQFAVQGKVTF